MSDYGKTPTTEQWRSWIGFIDTLCGHGGETTARFERWLAAEKAKWQAEALREAVRDARAAWEGNWNLRDPRDSDVAYSIDRWLEIRADRIEKGTDR